MSESKLEQLARLSQTNWVNWNAEEGDAVWGALPGLLRCVEALTELTDACEEEFGGDATDLFSDDEAVAAPSSHIDFGMIRRGRAALSALDEGAAP